MANSRTVQTTSIVDELTGSNPPRPGESRAPTTQEPTIGVAGPVAIRGVVDVDDQDVPKTLSALTAAVNRSYDLSTTRAGELNIPVIGSISGGYNRRVVVLERSAYKVVIGHSGAEYHFGYAIRLCLTVSKWDAAMKLSLPMVAASAQIGQVEASWMLQVLGLAGPEVTKAIVPPDELNVEKYVVAKQSLVALLNAVDHSSTTFSAHQLSKIEPRNQRDEDYRKSVAKAYALTRIARRWSLDDALNRLRSDDSVIADTVRDTYEEVYPGSSAERPSEEAAHRSRALLGRIEADI